jgi:hypothetical protein
MFTFFICTIYVVNVCTVFNSTFCVFCNGSWKEQQPPFPMAARAVSLMGKRLWACRSPLTCRAEVMVHCTMELYLHRPICLYGMHTDKLTFICIPPHKVHRLVFVIEIQ